MSERRGRPPTCGGSSFIPLSSLVPFALIRGRDPTIQNPALLDRRSPTRAERDMTHEIRTRRIEMARMGMAGAGQTIGQPTTETSALPGVHVGRRGPTRRLRRRWRGWALACTAVAGVLGLTAAPAGADAGSFIGGLPTRTMVASTVPANGDLNPYGVAVVPDSIGNLHRGSILVSNFNNADDAQGTGNQQGRGTTIVEVSPSGHVDLFAAIDPAHLPGACPGGVGLTTALAVLRSGWVIVGSLPTADGTSATAEAGCLLVLNAQGKVVETWAGGPINGPWDLAAIDEGGQATLLVTNVLNGTVAAGGNEVDRGTLVRITVDIDPGRAPRATSVVTVATGFAERTDPAALVVGPTGVAVSWDGTAYVADTVNSRIAAVPDATERFFPVFGGGRTVSSGGALNAPLGLALAPNGHLLSMNGGDGNMVETTPEGHQVATRMLDSSGDPPGAGALFGLAVATDRPGVWFVDDADNTLNLLHR
jgi:hypothetical protein